MTFLPVNSVSYLQCEKTVGDVDVSVENMFSCVLELGT